MSFLVRLPSVLAVLFLASCVIHTQGAIDPKTGHSEKNECFSKSADSIPPSVLASIDDDVKRRTFIEIFGLLRCNYAQTLSVEEIMRFVENGEFRSFPDIRSYVLPEARYTKLLDNLEGVYPTIAKSSILTVNDTAVGYIRIDSFSEKTGQELEKTYRNLSQEARDVLHGLVLDLRNNPGGSVDGADAVINLFLDGPRSYSTSSISVLGSPIIASRVERGTTRPEILVDPYPDMTETLPLLILMNEKSASASEIVAGALCRVFRRALCAGTRTFGKSTVQMMYSLSDGSGLILTTGEYRLGPPKCEVVVHGRGVEPDILLPEGVRVPHRIPGPHCRYQYTVEDIHWDTAFATLGALDLFDAKEMSDE